MSIATELTQMGAPRKVMEAAHECANCTSAGVPPPMQLVSFIRAWVARTTGQDRYGK